MEKGNKLADDLSDAVVWIEVSQPDSLTPEVATITTSDKEFRPHVIVVPRGSTVEFSNTDGFDHNVFSLTKGSVFDLGSYGRGETRSTTFSRPGIVRVYCDVHSNMSAVVVVRDNPFYAQPSVDGSFAIDSVPPGTYTMHAWHERAKEPVSLTVEITARGLRGIDLELDAREYEFVQHLNKFGRPYSTARRGRRY